jgi:glycosyltransferase involved in cell wall biosynthesis
LNPRLTIAICTFNRAALLDDALRSYAAMRKPSEIPVELLVVDNNSSDETAAVVRRWAGRSQAPLRYVFERPQGLSRARNRAVEEAAGDWIWFVDDDVYFADGWLDGVRDGLALFPDASVLAGRVVPAFDSQRPSWLPASALGYYGMTEFGNEPRWLDDAEDPVGANTAFRKSVLREVGPFRLDLGRVADGLTSCEEIDVVRRLRARGHRAAYVAHAEVLHRVTDERATMSWLRRRAYWGGVSCVLVDGKSRGAARWKLMCQAAERVRDVVRGALTKGLGHDAQIDYARQLGNARQYVTEALRIPRLLRS